MILETVPQRILRQVQKQAQPANLVQTRIVLLMHQQERTGDSHCTAESMLSLPIIFSHIPVKRFS